MRKYHKGRVLVLASMVGFTSITVLAGTGATQEWKGGKLQVSYTPAAFQKGFKQPKGKMKDVLPNACVVVDATKFHLDDHGHHSAPLIATFKGRGAIDSHKKNDFKPPTDFYGADVETTITNGGGNGIFYFDLSKWLSPSLITKKHKKLEKRGYHVELTIGKKHKSFWVWANNGNPLTGCPAVTVDGETAPPAASAFEASDRIPGDWQAEVVDAATDNSTDDGGNAAPGSVDNGSSNTGGGTHVEKCSSKLVDRTSWSGTSTVYIGYPTTFTVNYTDPSGLSEGSEQMTVDGQDIDMNDTQTVTTSRGDVAVISGSFTPTDTATHTLEVYAANDDGSCTVASTTFAATAANMG